MPETHYLVSPEGVLKEFTSEEIQENGGFGKMKAAGFSLPKEDQLKPLRYARTTPEEREAARTQPAPAPKTDLTVEKIERGAESIAEHPWAVPGAILPGLAVEGIGLISPAAQKKIGQIGGGLATGVAKSFLDMPVGIAGLAERALQPSEDVQEIGKLVGKPTQETDLRKAINRYQEVSEGLEARKPITTGIGEFSGTVGQALGGVGTTGAIAKLGSGVAEKVAGKLALKEAEQVAGKGLLRKAVAKAGGAAAAGGTENVLFNLADLDSKLEADPAPTIGKYAAGVGLDFLLGAGIGVGIAGAHAGMTGLARRLGGSAEKLAARSAGLGKNTAAQASGKSLLDQGLLASSAEETLTNVQEARNQVLSQIKDKVAAYSPAAVQDVEPLVGRGGFYEPVAPPTLPGTSQVPLSVRPPGATVEGGGTGPIGTKWWEGVQDPEMGKVTLDDLKAATDIMEAGGGAFSGFPSGAGSEVLDKPVGKWVRGAGWAESPADLGDNMSKFPGGYLKHFPMYRKMLADTPLVKEGHIDPDILAQHIDIRKADGVDFGQAVLKYVMDPTDTSWMQKEFHTGISFEPGTVPTKVSPQFSGGVAPKGDLGAAPPVESSGPVHVPDPRRARGPRLAAPPGYLAEPPLNGTPSENAPTLPAPQTVGPRDLGSLYPPPGGFPKTKQPSLEDILQGHGVPSDDTLKALVSRYQELTKLQDALLQAAKEGKGAQNTISLLKNIAKGGIGLEALMLLTGHSNPSAMLTAALGGVVLGLVKPSDAFAAKALSKGARAMGLVAGAENLESMARLAAMQLVRKSGSTAEPAAKPNRDRFEELHKAAQALQDNPEKMNQLVDAHVGPGAGPNTRAAAAMKITSVLGNLESKLPAPGQPDPLRPGKQRPFPDSAVDQFLMAADGADGPRLMGLIGSGRLTQQRWDSFEANHPEAVDTVRQALLSEIGEADDLDWRQRQQIGIVFGLPNYGTTPDLVRALQSKYDTAEEQKRAEDQEARIAGKTKTFSEKPYLTDTDRAEMGER